ncbi:MAG: allantoinase [Herpetosiphon sp.]
MMSTFDLLIRGGEIVDDGRMWRADIGVAGGRIVEIGPALSGSAHDEIDAGGLKVLPGVIDAHVHFNDPGRADWEGFETGSRAAAMGGTTTFFDMPLNAHPPTVNSEAWEQKCAAAAGRSLVDFALWGGLVPGNLDQLAPLAGLGVIGFKAFMANSGIADFEAVDDLTLYEGMRRAAELGCIVAVHAENDRITGELARRLREAGRVGVRDYLASRPVVAELEAIERALVFAEETGCAVHIVHVSTGRGVRLVQAARERGVDASCETCPHYLVLDEADMETLGAVAKCAPPLRPRAEQDELWQLLSDGHIPIVASDHSPAPATMKQGGNFFQVWGGISGCQTLLSLLLTSGYDARSVPLSLIAAVCAGNVARRFRLPGKGRIAVGADADLLLIDADARGALQSKDLAYRHQHSPFVGMELRGRVRRTVLRGTTVVNDGDVVSAPIGRLVSPQPR